MNKQKHIIIIGSGIGGLASACLLSKKGYKVTILEKMTCQEVELL